MPTISYCKENIEKYDFENKILQGIKIHTIRRYRKRLFKIGDTLYHYNQQRSPHGHKICENKCVYVSDIYIRLFFEYLIIYINGIFINEINTTRLAKNDGFDSVQNFKHYFTKSGLSFHGQIIGWVEGINYEAS